MWLVFGGPKVHFDQAMAGDADRRLPAAVEPLEALRTSPLFLARDGSPRDPGLAGPLRAYGIVRSGDRTQVLIGAGQGIPAWLSVGQSVQGLTVESIGIDQAVVTSADGARQTLRVFARAAGGEGAPAAVRSDAAAD
jgi:hypothetical protein